MNYVAAGSLGYGKDAVLLCIVGFYIVERREIPWRGKLPYLPLVCKVLHLSLTTLSIRYKSGFMFNFVTSY